MREINITQNTPEWHEFRARHVGASECAAILGLSKFKSREDLWKQKVGLGENQVDNEHMKRGRDLEPIVRDMINKKFGVRFKPAVFEHEQLNWLSASLDGWDEDFNIALEIKAPGAKDHECAKLGVPPIHYFPQLQGIMLVCELSEIQYASFFKDDLINIVVKRDQTFINDMLPKLEQFWDSVQNFIAPEPVITHKQLGDNEEWKRLAMDWRKCQQQKRDIEIREKDLRSALVLMSSNENAKGWGLKLTKISKRGSVQYVKIPELQGVDLEKYRGTTSEYWRIDETT
jgi:putative phage-type endonuclease